MTEETTKEETESASNHSRAFPLISRRESPLRFSCRSYIKKKLLFPLIKDPERLARSGRVKVRKAKMDFNGFARYARVRGTQSSPKSYN